MANKPVKFRLTMKPTANKHDVLVNHNPREIRAASIHFTNLGNGVVVAAEDIESIEIIGEEND